MNGIWSSSIPTRVKGLDEKMVGDDTILFFTKAFSMSTSFLNHGWNKMKEFLKIWLWKPVREMRHYSKLKNILWTQQNILLSNSILRITVWKSRQKHDQSLFLSKNRHFSVKPTFLLKSWFHGKLFFVCNPVFQHFSTLHCCAHQRKFFVRSIL